MNPCDEIRSLMAFYLDDELLGGERGCVESHLRDCEACREMFDKEHRFLERIRGSSPLYTASRDLRSGVEGIVSGARPLESRDPIKPGPWRAALSIFKVSNRHRLTALGAAVAIVVFFVVVWRLSHRDEAARGRLPSDFALMAVDTHLRHLRGELPLEVTSGSPEEISGWFANKVRFTLELPNYQESSGQEKLYRLEGARLVGYQSDYAAYVAYLMRMRPISLVVTSNSVAMPRGGDVIVSNGLTFHCDSIDDLKVITWSDRGLTYALVSDLEERGQQSCMVCHQGAQDQDFIEGLKPKGF